MKRYRDIEEQMTNVPAEIQLLLNEATLGRNLSELTMTGLRGDSQIATAPVLVDGDIIFRVAVFERGTIEERDALIQLAQGKTYSNDCLIINGDSPYLDIFKVKSMTKKNEEE